MDRRTFLTGAAMGAAALTDSSSLAVDGGKPIRETPLRAGFYGTQFYDDKERRFEFKRVAYDIDAAAQKIFTAKLERNFGNRLFIGV